MRKLSPNSANGRLALETRFLRHTGSVVTAKSMRDGRAMNIAENMTETLIVYSDVE
jgi:hypothetical protein